jgi:hypothetical protein
MTNVYAGNYSLNTSATGVNSTDHQCDVVSDYASIVGGSTYLLTEHFYDPGSGESDLAVDFYDSNYNLIGPSIWNPQNSQYHDQWYQAEIVAVAPTDAAYARVFVDHYFSSTGYWYGYSDDIFLGLNT